MTSKTASSNQPVATKRLYTFDEYTTSTDQPAMMMRINTKDMAKFYAEHPQQSGWYESNWNSCFGSKYVKASIYNASDALQLMNTWEFPSELKLSAARTSRYLSQVFEDVAKITVIHDLTSGRLDRRKLPQIARHTASNTFNVDEIRPYRRTIPSPSKKPTIAIVASAGNAEMWRDSDYIPRVVELSLGILWACEAAGLETYAALSEGFAFLDSATRFKEAVSFQILAEPNTITSPRAYAVMMHRDLYRHGFMTAQCADREGNIQGCKLMGYAPGRNSYGAIPPSYNGGNAVNGARKVLNADVVIAIGNITDSKTADIQLGSKFDIDSAVKSVAQQAQKLTR